jgi:hypothetical protein
MSGPTLSNPADPWFAFQHAMYHRNALGVMSPLTRFSVIPYFIDPATGKRSADSWYLNHGQAHNDAMNNLPSTYLGEVTAGSGVGANLVDTVLDNPWSRSWWVFQNNLEHYVGANTILPAPQIPPPPPAPTWTFPFW